MPLQSKLISKILSSVIPAKAGIQVAKGSQRHWIPAFAGMTGSGIFRLVLSLVFTFLFFSNPGPSNAQERFVDHWGLSAGFSSNFHPDTRVQMWFLSPDLSHKFSERWQGRLEGFLGMTQIPEQRVALGLTPVVAYDLKAISCPHWFLEAGVGLFYTDVSVPGVGSHWVFSPQLGIARSFEIDSRRAIQMRLRYHHLSNAYLNPNNTSIDSIMFMVGMNFGQ
jgi:lipid A 3-O-deacylase